MQNWLLLRFCVHLLLEECYGPEGADSCSLCSICIGFFLNLNCAALQPLQVLLVEYYYK